MSAVHSLLQRITASISARISSSSGTYQLTDNQYNYAIGGVPLLSAATDGPGYGAAYRPDVEQAIEQRKEQFDNYKDPGEYSLNQWWLRSQTSFVGGAGVTYQDPDTQGQALNIRYNKSIGIDPFSDVDNIQLLKQTNASAAWTADANLGRMFIDAYARSTSSNAWIARGGRIDWATVGNSDISIVNTRTLSIGDPLGQITGFTTEVDTSAPGEPSYCYAFVFDPAGSATAGVWRGTHSSTTMTQIYLPPSFDDDLVLELLRGTLYCSVRNKLYQLDRTASAGTAWPAAPIVQVPVNQVIVAMTDGPDGIYVAANSEDAGYIYRTTFNSSTGAINGLTQVAILPNGEQINSIASYVATYLIITTRSGIRVGAFTGSGISYGPPVITVPVDQATDATGPYSTASFDSNSGFGDVAFHGDRAYVAVKSTTSPQHDGSYGIIALNLGVIISDNNTGAQENSYCTWVYNTGATVVDALATTYGGRCLFGSGRTTATAKLFIEDKTTLLASGYLDTGRCRYNTLEPKLFKFMSIKTPTPLRGDVSVAVLDEGGGVTNYVTYNSSLGPGINDVALPIPAGQQNWLALRFTLHRNGSDATVGGQLDAWQLKALPGTIKQRSISKWFLLFNAEKDKSGQVIYNSALDRLQQIREFCQRGDTVTFQDLVNNISDQVVIDNYEFRMLAPPGPNAENYGGYLRLDMRTVADVVPPIAPASGVSND